MQFEDFDKKVREAADNHHPVYNENAWPQMEKLLNKHLPQKEDNRRRFIFLLLLLLGLGAGGWFISERTFGKRSLSAEASMQGKNNTKDQPSNIISNETKDKSSITPITPGSDEHPDPTSIFNNHAVTGSTSANNSNGNKVSTGNSKERTASPLSVYTRTGITKGRKESLSTSNEKTDGASENIIPSLKTVDNTDAQSNPGDQSTLTTVAKTPIADEKKTDTAVKIESINLTDKAIVITKKKSATKPARKGFAFLFAAGVDKSTVGFAKAGTTKPVLGAGVSFTYKKFTLSSGVYSGRKIYTAAPSDYKFAYTPPNYNYLKTINADCNVLEIPINVSWNFIEQKKGSWFIGTGVSSLIMKSEKYGYVYKYPNGQSYTHKAEYSNKNQHLFSLVNFSGGYKRYLSKSIFVSAEPYIKLPLKGVGVGKINLHGTGIMFTAGIQPFNFRN